MHLLVLRHNCYEILLIYKNSLPFDHICFFHHSAIKDTQNKHVLIMVIVIKSVKTEYFRFLPDLLACLIVFTKLSNISEFPVSNLPKKAKIRISSRVKN